jgi:hypothetical protein
MSQCVTDCTQYTTEAISFSGCNCVNHISAYTHTHTHTHKRVLNISVREYKRSEVVTMINIMLIVARE